MTGDAKLRAAQTPVVLFDGVCGLCDGFVRFVLARDRAARFRFAPLQGAFARARLSVHDRRAEALDAMYVLTADGGLLERSDAVLFVLRELGGIWAVAAVARVLPRGLRDFVYRAIARARYRLFGKRDACRLPTPAERARFIDDGV